MSYFIINHAYRESGLKAATLELAFEETVRLNRLDSFIPVVPTSRLARLLQRRIVREIFAQTSAPIAPVQACNFEQLVLKLFRLTPNSDKFRIISDAYRLALFEEAGENADLHFFRRKKEQLSPIALQRLSSVIFGLKEDGITPHHLFEDIKTAGDNQKSVSTNDADSIDAPKLEDLAALYSEYEKLLGDNLLDKPAILQRTTECLIRQNDLSQAVALNPRTIIFFEGFTEFKQPEAQFIIALAKTNIPIAIHLDYSSENGPLFGNLADTLASFGVNGLFIKELDETPRFNDELSLHSRIFSPLGAYLRRWLFNTERQIFNKDLSNYITVLAAGNRIDEIITISKLVRHLIIEEKIHPSKICVATRQIDLYADAIREIFDVHNIPANVTDRFLLSKSPVVAAIFSILDVILSGFYKHDVHRAIHNPYLQFVRNGNQEPIDSANLYGTAERLRLMGGVRYGGKKGWKTALENEIKRTQIRLERLQNDTFADRHDILRAERELHSAQTAALDFAAICENLPDLHIAGLPSEIALLIKRAIIEKFKIQESIESFYRHATERVFTSSTERSHIFSEIEKDARALSAVLNLLDEIAGIQEQRFGERKISFQDFTEKFRTAVIGAKYQVREKSGHGITVTTLEQTRGIPFQIIICCGLNDGEFPAAYIPDSFLGKDLPETEDRYIRAERMQFYQILSSILERNNMPERHIYLSYCTQNEGEQIVRSPFIDALLKISTLKEDGRIFSINQIRAASIVGNCSNDKQQCSWLAAITSSVEMTLYANQAKTMNLSLPKHIIDTLQYCDFYLDNKGKANEKLSNELPADIFDLLKQYSTKSYSITDLETYAECPYKYFASRFLQLNERKNFDASLTAIERGSLLHIIVYRFFRKIQDEMLESGEAASISKQQSNLLPSLAQVKLKPEMRDYYRALLLEIAHEELSTITFEHPFFDVEKKTLLGDSNRKGDLERWLDAELESITARNSFYPALFEFGFGTKTFEGSNGIKALNIGELHLKGKIDRLEIFSDENNAKFIIADYKSGKSVKTNTEIKALQSFQMPLYLLAAQKLLADYYKLSAELTAAVYYHLRPSYDSKKSKKITESFVLLPKNSKISREKELEKASKQTVADESERDMLINNSAKRAREIIESVSDGNFPIQPFAREVCKYCPFSQVCRINEFNK